MNFTAFRFYLAEPDNLGDFICTRIRDTNYTRTPISRIIVIDKNWPRFLDKYMILWKLYPMEVKINN
jgi:hypothetical protein